jgi:predicted permease
MTETLSIVLPVFALIGLGFLCGWRRWLPDGTGKGLADFTFQLAVPALLFRTVATTAFPPGAAIGVLISFFTALAATWALTTVVTRVALQRPQEDAASISMSASYGNVIMLGIPLATNAYGPAAAVPIAILLSVHTPLLWLLGSLHMAYAQSGRGGSPTAIVGGVLADLSRNPIILAVLAGTLWRLTGFGLDPIVDRTLGLLAQASVPSALIALGLGLVQFQIKGQVPTLTLILVAKLIAMPVLAALLAIVVLRLDPVAAGVVVVFAAMPSGANAYLFATRHQRALNSASGAVALGTALSAISVAVIVTLMPGTR